MGFWDTASDLANKALKYVATNFGPGKTETEAKKFIDQTVKTTGKVTAGDWMKSRPLSVPTLFNPMSAVLPAAATEMVIKPFSRAVASIVTSASGKEISVSPLSSQLYGEGIAGEKAGNILPLVNVVDKVNKGEGFGGKIATFLNDKTGIPTKFSSPIIVGGFLLADLFPENPFHAKEALTATKSLNEIAKISDNAVEIASKLAKGEEVTGASAHVIAGIKSVVDGFDATKAAEKIPGTDIQKIMGNVNMEKFDIPKDMLSDMGDLVMANGGYVEQRRGVRTWKDTNEAAAAILPKLKLKPGKSLNAEELQSLGIAVAGLQKNVSELSQAVKVGATDDLSLLKLAHAKEQLGFALASWSGATAEAGRSLQILRQMKSAIDLKDPVYVKKALEFAGGRKSIEEISQAIAALGDDEIAKFNYVRSLYKPTFRDYAGYYWYTNLLSGPLTQVRNFAGNLFNASRLFAERPLAAGIDIAKTAGSSLLGGSRKREVFAGELPAAVVGYYSGIKHGFMKGLDVMEKGYTLDNVLNSEFKKPEVFKGILPNAVSRLMEATDLMFFSAANESEMNAKAYAIAKKEGKKGNEIAVRMAELISDPSKNLLEESMKFGKKATFREDPGTFEKWLMKGKKTIPGFEFVVPFIQTPSNIIKQGFEMTPLGLIPKRGLSGRQMTQRQATVALGSLMLAPLALYAVEGNISGNGPTNQEELARLYRTGWQKNSIKVGDQWISYTTTGPLAVPLAMIANAAEAYKYDNKSVSVTSIAARSINSFLDSTFLSGLNSLLSALADPEYKGKQYAYNLVTSLTPGSQFFGQINRGLDPIVRRADSVLEAVKSKFPGLSESVTPMRNVFGEVVTRPGGFFNQSMNILRYSFDTDQSTKVDGALHDSGIQVTIPSRSLTIGGTSRKMDEKDYSEYLRVSGTIKLNVLDTLVDSPLWSKASLEERSKMVSKVTEAGNKKAKDSLSVGVELKSLGLMPIDDEATSAIIGKVIETKAYKALQDDSIRKNLILKVLSAAREGTLSLP